MCVQLQQTKIREEEVDGGIVSLSEAKAIVYTYAFTHTLTCIYSYMHTTTSKTFRTHFNSVYVASVLHIMILYCSISTNNLTIKFSIFHHTNQTYFILTLL